MGYLLPISNFQSNQELIRSCKRMERFSYILPVQKTKQQSQLGRELERRSIPCNAEYWRKIPHAKKKIINTSPHNSSSDLNFLDHIGRGLYFDFYA